MLPKHFYILQYFSPYVTVTSETDLVNYDDLDDVDKNAVDEGRWRKKKVTHTYALAVVGNLITPLKELSYAGKVCNIINVRKTKIISIPKHFSSFSLVRYLHYLFHTIA